MRGQLKIDLSFYVTGFLCGTKEGENDKEVFKKRKIKNIHAAVKEINSIVEKRGYKLDLNWNVSLVDYEYVQYTCLAVKGTDKRCFDLVIRQEDNTPSFLEKLITPNLLRKGK